MGEPLSYPALLCIRMKEVGVWRTHRTTLPHPAFEGRKWVLGEPLSYPALLCIRRKEVGVGRTTALPYPTPRGDPVPGRVSPLSPPLCLVPLHNRPPPPPPPPPPPNPVISVSPRAPPTLPLPLSLPAHAPSPPRCHHPRLPPVF